MKHLFKITLLSMLAFLFIGDVKSQEKKALKKRPQGMQVARTFPVKANATKAALIKEELGISQEASLQVVAILHEHEQLTRRLYMDNTKTSEQRIAQKNVLSAGKDAKLKVLLNEEQMRKLRMISLKIKNVTDSLRQRKAAVPISKN